MANSHQNIKYLEYRYPDDHWAVDPEKEGTGIARFLYCNKYRFLVKFNPTDSRGYRILVTYLGKLDDPIQNTFNRPYNAEEHQALYEVVTMMMAVYKSLGIPIVQTAQAGNNAHSFDLATDSIVIGNEREPALLHAHLWGRDDTENAAMGIAPIDGPHLGVIFDMAPKNNPTKGNEGKKPWKENQLNTALTVLKLAILNYMQTDEFTDEYSKTLKVEIINPTEDLAHIQLPPIKKTKLKNLDPKDIPNNHFLLNPKNDPSCLAFFTFRDVYQYCVQLNPDDQRGYRLLVRYLGEKGSDIRSAFKPSYTTAEQKGLANLSVLMFKFYEFIGLPIVQILQAGNKSQGYDETTQTLLLGFAEEPAHLFTHIIGRGNPSKIYLGVPLLGPKPGTIFDTSGKTAQVSGNEQKLPWNKQNIGLVVQQLKLKLNEYMKTTECCQHFQPIFTFNIAEQVTVQDQPSTQQSATYQPK